MRRTVIPELLDSDAGTPAEIAASLGDLRRINRWFGGAGTMCDLARRVAVRTGARDLTLLDVAGASGDIVAEIARRLRPHGIRLRFVLLDRAASHMQHRPAVVADATRLPFADNSFDLVGSSLFTHHLEPAQFVEFIHESLRVCRWAALVNDLRRSPLHLALVYAGYPLYRSRLTRHDGPASVRRAYTVEEVRQLLQQTPAAEVEIENHYLYRMGGIAWKRLPPQEARTRT